MAKKVILGTDIARDAFKTKVNDNFTELYNKDVALGEQINDFADQVISKKIEVTSTDDATSVTDAPLKSAGGMAVAKRSYFGDTINTKENGIIYASLRYKKAVFNSYDNGIFLRGKRIKLKFSISNRHLLKLDIDFFGRNLTNLSNKSATAKKTIYVANNSSGSNIENIKVNEALTLFTTSEIYAEAVAGDSNSFWLYINFPAALTDMDIANWLLTLDVYGTSTVDVNEFIIEDII